mgnify:CR=1 FL=1
MPRAPAAKDIAPLLLSCGGDEFAAKQRAREAYERWCEEIGGMDHETIDATAINAGEALKALVKLNEALNTLPFFGGGKVIWLKDCNFLGDDRTASSAAVTEGLAGLAQTLKTFPWDNVRLIINSGKVDKRKTFYKTVSKLGTVETFAGLSIDDRDWADKAEDMVARHLKSLKVAADPEALAAIVNNVGPNAAQLKSEVEKIATYVGDAGEITAADVEAVSVKNKQARAFALGDALGDRNLPRLLHRLDEELWEMQFDKKKSEIGMLYGLISKVRVMLFIKEMLSAGMIRAAGNYPAFKSQLERVPADAFPEDRRINPLSMNPYVLFRALPQAANYSRGELVQAMDRLLKCNRQLVSSSTDGALVMQQTLTQIVRGDETGKPAARRGR